MKLVRGTGIAAMVTLAMGLSAGITTAAPAPAPMPSPVVPGMPVAAAPVAATPQVNVGRTVAAKPVEQRLYNPANRPVTAPVPAPEAKPDPSLISLEILPGVHYTASGKDGSAVITSAIGSFTQARGQIQLTDPAGKLVFGSPITAGTDPATWPIAAHAVPTTNVSLDLAHAALSLPGLTRNADSAMDDFNAALGVFSTNFGLATGIGSLVGGGIGLVVGCPLGAVTAGLVGLPAIPTGVGWPILMGLGCLVGAGTIAGIGAVLGSMIVGIPVGIASGVQMYNTLHEQGHV